MGILGLGEAGKVEMIAGIFRFGVRLRALWSVSEV